MNFSDYERLKFEIADILRAATPKARAINESDFNPFSDLFQRLAEDRFNIVVAGKFSRGKSTLMNAMLNTERLPTGIVPLTSVITTVQYGPLERAFLQSLDHHFETEIDIDLLPQFVTQQDNPGNVKRVKLARIELPSEILKRGFFLVDTPGLGSSIIENTRTTEDFLPEADAAIVVTSYDSALSEEEFHLLANLIAADYRIFLVLNKEDLASVTDRAQVLNQVRHQIDGIAGGGIVEIYSLSAHRAVAARRSGDPRQLSESGLSALMDRLTEFLITEKRSEFLYRLCDRMVRRLGSVTGTSAEVKRILDLQSNLIETAEAAHPQTPEETGHVVQHFAACHICQQAEREVRSFLQTFQYEITVDDEVRDRLASHAGLCAFHTWQYAQLASPVGTSIAFPIVLEELAERIALIANDPSRPQSEETAKLVPTNATCAVCLVQKEAEGTALTALCKWLRSLGDSDVRFPDLCLPHLPQVLGALGIHPAAARLLLAQSAAYRQIAEDMRRYALKHDAYRRALSGADEVTAHMRALIALGGNRSLRLN